MDKVALVARQRVDFPFYASTSLSILDKNGSRVPLSLNKAQLTLHRLLEQQRSERGWVRALVLKGRQQGISTYVQARARWRLKHRKGAKAYTVAHEQRATDNLFAMAKRYHDYEPEDIRPSTGASNAKELWLDKLDTKFEYATAGTKAVGRSGTAQFLHASEFGYWPSAADHWAGIGQVIPLAEDTEVLVESTANGVNDTGGEFYARWKQAIHGKGDFIAVFLPWFWQPEYAREVPKDWGRTQDEDELASLYGLNDEQLAWRRAKIESDFGGDASKFQQEYPSNWQEAFVASNRDTLISARLVLRAQASKETVGEGPLLLGVDPARYGDDRTALVARRGRRVVGRATYENRNTMEVAGIVARFIEKYSPQRVFIDVIGLGAGVYDRLIEMGFGKVVVDVNASERAVEEEKYVNRRAENWGQMKQWFEKGPVHVPDGDDWLADLTAPGYTYDSAGRLRLESKENIKKRGDKSPDLGDALAMTFSEPTRTADRSSPKLPGFEALDEVAGY